MAEKKNAVDFLVMDGNQLLQKVPWYLCEIYPLETLLLLPPSDLALELSKVRGGIGCCYQGSHQTKRVGKRGHVNPEKYMDVDNLENCTYNTRFSEHVHIISSCN